MAWPWLRHAFGALLVAAQPPKGIGRVHEPADYRFRVFGMMGMFGVIGIAPFAAFCGALMGGRGLLESTDHAPYASSFGRKDP